MRDCFMNVAGDAGTIIVFPKKIAPFIEGARDIRADGVEGVVLAPGSAPSLMPGGTSG